jgi:hypothetical protein
VITAWKALARLDHRGRDIESIDAIDQGCQRTRDEARSAAEVEDSARLIGDQPCQDIERLWWIWRAMSVGCNDGSILELGRNLGSQESWWLVHSTSRYVSGHPTTASWSSHPFSEATTERSDTQFLWLRE